MEYKVTGVNLTQDDFESGNLHIGDFTQQLLAKNEKNGVKIGRIVANMYWVLEVKGAYTLEHPGLPRLLDQVDCPLIEAIWRRHTDAVALLKVQAKHTLSGFWPIGAEGKDDRGALIVGNATQNFTIPEVLLLPIKSIHFVELSKKVIKSNINRSTCVVDYATMRELWRTLVEKLYYYEPEDVRQAKLTEGLAVSCTKFLDDASDSKISDELSKKRKTPDPDESAVSTARACADRAEVDSVKPKKKRQRRGKHPPITVPVAVEQGNACATGRSLMIPAPPLQQPLQKDMIALGPKVAKSVHYRAHEFEVLGLNIVDYTMDTLQKNMLLRIRIDRDKVEEYWAADLAAVYSENDHMFHRMLQQVHCPMNQDFWDEYTDPSAFFLRKSNESTNGFRPLLVEDKEADNGEVLLTDGYEIIRVPSVGLLCLQAVEYLSVVREVQANNAGLLFSESKMQRIWQSIVSNIYCYESDSTRKAKMAELAGKHAKGYWTAPKRAERMPRKLAVEFFDDLSSSSDESDSRRPIAPMLHTSDATSSEGVSGSDAADAFLSSLAPPPPPKMMGTSGNWLEDVKRRRATGSHSYQKILDLSISQQRIPPARQLDRRANLKKMAQAGRTPPTGPRNPGFTARDNQKGLQPGNVRGRNV